MCDGEGSSRAAYFKKPLVVCQTFLCFKCGEEETVFQFLYVELLHSGRTNSVLEVRTHCIFMKLCHLHLWQISHCLFRASLFSVKFAGGQPHSSGNERYVGLLLHGCNCRRVLKWTNFPQRLCVFVLLGDGGCFTVPLPCSFGLESIPSWPEFGSGSCILKGRNFASRGWRKFVSCLPLRRSWAAASLRIHSALLHRQKKKNFTEKPGYTTARMTEWHQIIIRKGSRLSVTAVWLFFNAQPLSWGF